MGLNYPSQSAIAAVLESIGQQKKKKAMEDTLDKARQKGYDIEIVIDPETGKQATKLRYKGKSRSEMVKDQFDVAKMIAEMQKWQRGEKEATQEEEYQGKVGEWMGTKPTSLLNRALGKEDIKNLLLYRNRNLRPEFQGQEFMRSEKGKYRQVTPKAPKAPVSIYNEDEYITDLQKAISAIKENKDPNIVFKKMLGKYGKDPKKILEMRKLLFPELFQKQTESSADQIIKMKEAGVF